MPTPNPPDFEEAVHEHLRGTEEQFNYEQMLLTFLDNERFHRWAAVVAHHRAVAGTRFLSSGCGFGGALLAYHDAGAEHVTGTEIDATYARMADLRISEITDAEVVLVDDEHLPFGAESFDLVESMDVIEHTMAPFTYLAELGRVLTPGGLILLVTPNRLWPVEQHLEILGPPWLPIGVADRLFATLARLPGLSPDRKLRYERLRPTRTQNISLRKLRRWAKDLGLLLSVLPASLHAERWPLPRHAPWLERMAAHRLLSYVAPVRTLVVTLERADARSLRDCP